MAEAKDSKHPEIKRHNLSEQFFMDKNIVVVGLGISGLWSARCLADLGANVTVSDVKSETQLNPDYLKMIFEKGILLDAGGHKKGLFLSADMIIVSPGVSHDMELLCVAASKGIPVIGELELASRLIRIPIIAVTGTNGKSTVTSLLGQLLENAGIEAFVGGNIGTPLIACVARHNRKKYAVVEVSSFQLDTTDTFCPFVSVLLNISPDHLDRYPDFDAYVRSKLKIFRNQGKGHYVVLNDDDKRLSSLSMSPDVTVLRYGLEEKNGRCAFIHNGMLTIRINNTKKHFSLESFSLKGPHNLGNLLSVVICASILGIENTVIQETIDNCKGLPDRLELVAEKDEILFYNDSKATNIDAAIKAIMSIERPIILLAGGRHKGANYGDLVNIARRKVKMAILMGETKEILSKSFKGIIPYILTNNMEEAVSLAFSHAKAGDAILLAPACSSFDMYENFVQRGNAFKTAIERLVYGS